MVAETDQEPIVQYLTEKVTNISESDVGKAIKKNLDSVPILEKSVKLLAQTSDGAIQYVGELSAVLRETTGGAKDQLWVYASKAKDVRDNIPIEKIQAYIEGGIETSKSYIPTTDSFISFLDHDKDGTVTCSDVVSHCNDFSDYVVAKAQEYYPEALVALLLSYTMPLYTRFLEIELFQKFLSMAFVSTILQFLTELPASYLDAIQVWWYCHVPAESLKTPLSSIFSLAFWKATLIKLVYRDEELISFITECVAVFTGYSIWYPFILSLKPNCAEKDVDVKMSAADAQ